MVVKIVNHNDPVVPGRLLWSKIEDTESDRTLLWLSVMAVSRLKQCSVHKGVTLVIKVGGTHNEGKYF